MGRSHARRGDAGDRRGARAGPHVRRGVRQGARGARGAGRVPGVRRARCSASRCPSGGTCCSRPPVVVSSCRASIPTSQSSCARSPPSPSPTGRPVRLAVDSCAGEFEARTPYYYVTHEGVDEGPVPSGRAVDRARRRAEPDRPGDRVRLLLRPRSAGAAEARLRGGARELEPRDGLDRLRHLRPALPRAAHSSRACSRCASSSVRSRVAVSFGGQTPLRLAPALAAAGVPLLGDPLDAIDAAEDRGALRGARRRARTGVGSGGGRRRGARDRGPARLPGARAAAPCARRPGHARRPVCRRARRRPGRASSTGTSTAPSSSTSTRLCDGEEAWVAAILEHVEPAGVHSGDSCLPPAGPVRDAGVGRARSARPRRPSRAPSAHGGC